MFKRIAVSFAPKPRPHHIPLPGFKFPAHQLLHSLLPRCRSMNHLKQLHAHLIAAALLDETLTLAQLISFCSLSPAGNLCYGRKLLEHAPNPNKFMYNSLIRGYTNQHSPKEALFLCRRMLRHGLLPNQFTLPFVLKSCAEASALEETLVIHGLIIKLGFESQIFVMNALLHVYSSCGPIWFARRVFDEIPSRNAVSWNSMIGGYSQLGDCKEAFSLFKMMRESGLVADEFTLVILLSACSQAENFELGRLVHQYIEVSGAKFDLIVRNALVDMYGKCGRLLMAQRCFDTMDVKNVVSWTSMVCAHAKHGLIEVARDLFDRMPERNIVSWNAMISCYVQNGLSHEALDLYDQMHASKVTPDEVTLIFVLMACAQNGNLVFGKNIHYQIRDNIEQPSIALFNSLIDMYAKCGPIEIALDLFSTMPSKSAISWNVIIWALAIHGRAFDAVDFFNQMIEEGFLPDGVTFVGLLSACSHCGLVEIGQSYFETMNVVYNVPYEIEHYACMVDLLGRGGLIQRAVELIKSMPMKPDIVIWGALLGACRIHGYARIGEQVMKHLLSLEMSGGGLHVLISNMYCENHRWEKMKTLRRVMREKGIKKDAGVSSIEINSILHEFLVEDMRHESSTDIYFVLCQLADHLISVEHCTVSPEELLDVEK
ncbi:pentatricopeptide repeat-containing protein At2g22410, mitochondrial-like isoform X1 [Ananas comosus]|uniref:Pentatricopeptide repeat-containing protein At2g22410, mitochondrial-like isoform X1 n=1 Tax=Ananas comosus TaxID=4615 RepID=A0A6P5FEI1_ANACO|nr:pentatricopeptide repeat-containing protein At2g22410, mitochondrial-like isoform X1 [Ananas comosus]